MAGMDRTHRRGLMPSGWTGRRNQFRKHRSALMPHAYWSGLGVVAEGESFELCVAYEAGPSPVKSVANGGRCCPHLKLPIQFRVLNQLLLLRAS